MSVLVTGGSGYLGQFVVQELAKSSKVGFTYCQADPPHFNGDAQGFKVDLVSGEGLAEAFSSLGEVALVVNCAAISQPGVCEKDPEAARAVNVPSRLLDLLGEQRRGTGREAALVHVSTDQVYDGGRALWTEADACEPVNAYGSSKLEAEREIALRWPRSAILRSSIIYGPPPPAQPVRRALFLQFMVDSLGRGERTQFFEDEFRSPVYVKDILRAIRAAADSLLAAATPEGSGARVYNMGGPARMSRVDMARSVASACGLDASCIVPCSAASVDRGAKSPADISMDSSLLERELGITTTPFEAALLDKGMPGSEHLPTSRATQ